MKFSVAICVYDGDDAAHFSAAVASIQQQAVPPTEIVLVVDGPVRPELDTVIKGYEGDTVFKVVRLAENSGHGMARRTAIQNTSYELVAVMDADDLAEPVRFARQLDCFAADAQLSIVGGQIEEFFSITGQPAGRRIVPEKNEEIYQYMKYRSPFNQMTVMFRKTAVERAGGYLDWFCNEDYYLWLRMAMQGCRFYNLPEVLVRVRVDEKMYQRRGGWKYFRSEWKLQRFMLKNGIIHFPGFLYNSMVRLTLQVLCPNNLRAFLFRTFARQ